MSGQSDHLKFIKKDKQLSEEEKFEFSQLNKTYIGYDELQVVQNLKNKNKLSLIESWNIKTINFSKGNNHLRTFKIIAEISFPFLTEITITSSGIHEIQSINRLNAPNLIHLNLGINRIHSIRPLRKCNFKLKILGMVDNKFRDQHLLPEVIMDDTVGQYVIEYSKTQNINAVWMAKLPCKHIQRVALKTKDSIRQPTVLKAIQRRYKGINIEIKVQ